MSESDSIVWKDFFGNSLSKGDIILYTPWSGGGLNAGIFYGVGVSNDNFVRLKLRIFTIKYKYIYPDPNRKYHRVVDSTYPFYTHTAIDCRRGKQSNSENLEVVLVPDPLYRMDNDQIVKCLQAKEFLNESEKSKRPKKKNNLTKI